MIDRYSPDISPFAKEDGTPEGREKKIRDLLMAALPEEAYTTWIENFDFEDLDGDVIRICYYGDQPLKRFNREYKETVSFHICSVVGYRRKMKVYKAKMRRKKKKAAPSPKKNIAAAKFFVISLLFAAVTFGIAVMGFNYIGNRNFKEAFYSVSSLKVNNKIRIIQISDLHNCTYGKENKKLISRIEKLKPDLIIYTGDCIDSISGSEEGTLALCGKLSKVAPSYYIYGNNETEKYYGFSLTQEALDKKLGFDDSNRKPEELLKMADSLETELEKRGVNVLKNESATLTVGTTEVDVYGVLTSNPSSFWSYGGTSFDSYIYNNTQNLKVTAIHEPVVFEEYTPDSWGDLMLAGHTHGGTVRLPVFGPLFTHEGGILPERKGLYVYGRYEVSGSPLIISSGLTNRNILRINNQPELVIVDINRF